MKVVGVLMMAAGVMLVYWTFKGPSAPISASTVASGIGSGLAGGVPAAPPSGSGSRPSIPS